MSYVTLRDLVTRELEAMGHGDVRLPSQPTFIKLVKRYAPELTHSAKRRRSDASRGNEASLRQDRLRSARPVRPDRHHPL